MKKPRPPRQYFFDLKPAQRYAKKLRKDGWPLADVGPVLIESAFQYVVDPTNLFGVYSEVSINSKLKPPAKVRAKKSEKKVDAWLCGYAACLSNLIRTHGETGLAKVAMDSDGLTLAMFKRAGIEKYDLDALKRAR